MALQNNARRWRTPAMLGLGVLAASYLIVRTKTRQVERDNPPAGQFIEVDGVRLHYVEYGEGRPPVVLLHGNSVYVKDFDASGVAARAAAHHRVIAFDRPGYGHSERPRSTIWTPAAQARLLHKALRQLGVERPVLVAHSWGTLVALAMAIEFPDDVGALVLASGYYYPSLRLDVPLASPPAIPLIGDLWRLTLAPLLSRLFWPLTAKAMFAPLPVPDSFRRLPPWMMLRPSQMRAEAAEAMMMIPSAMTLARHYRELRMPVKLIAGMGDKVVDPAHNSERLHHEVAHSEYEVQSGVGHMVHYASPDEIVAAIDELSPLPSLRPAAPVLAGGEASLG